MKKVISVLMAIAMVLSFAACGSAKNESSAPVSSASSELSKLDVDCNVYALKGPTGVGMVSLMDKADNGEGLLNYNFNLAAANDEIVSKLVNKEADIAAVATNLASTLYKKTDKGIKVLAVNTLGVLCLVTKGEEISSVADLKGKTVYSTGQGANPEYILNYVLAQNGLTAGTDVTVNFVSQPEELVTTVVSNENAIVLAPQPVATTITVKDKSAKIALDFNDEWDKVSDSRLVMGCIVVRNEYLEQNPEAVKAFMQDYAESVKAVNSDTETAGQLCEKYGIVASAAIAKAAIPYCNIVFEDGKELKTDLSAYLKFMFDASPASVGGELPDDNFYYEAK